MLIFEIQISGNQGHESVAFRSAKELTVLELGPPAFICSDDFVVSQRLAQWDGRALIEKDAHLCWGQGTAGCMLQNRTHLLGGYARKPLDELRYLGSVFEILEQCGNGYSRAAKYPCATDPLRVALYSITGGPIDHSEQGITGKKTRLTSVVQARSDDAGGSDAARISFTAFAASSSVRSVPESTGSARARSRR